MAKKELQELFKKQQQLFKVQAKNSYSKYVEYVHEGRWLPAKHLLFVCNTLEKFINGEIEGKSILILQMPPQHGKSMTVTETLPSYFLGRNPYKRVIVASYGDDLANRFGRKNKDKIERFGKELFDIQLSKKTASATEFELSNGVGCMISRGIMAGITGQPADLIIVDDPIKNRREADSETSRENVWEEYLNSINTRQSAKGKIVLIMTRWHEDDLAGRLINNMSKKVHVINLPCEAEENDQLGRNVGDALAPEIGKDNAWLTDFKESYTTAEGSRAWNSLFQGRPTAQEGNIIKKFWIKYWCHKGTKLPPVTFKLESGEYFSVEPIEIPDDFDLTLQSWDLAFKGDKENDKVAGQVWSNKGAKIFLNDNVNKNLTFTETITELERISRKHINSTLKLIEDKANGSAIIDMLQYKVRGIVPITPKESKQARMSAVSPLFEAGNVYIPHPLLYDWVNEFVEQLISFPNAKNDDMCDACSMALQRFMYSNDIVVSRKKSNEYDDDDEDEIKQKGWFD